MKNARRNLFYWFRRVGFLIGFLFFSLFLSFFGERILLGEGLEIFQEEAVLGSLQLVNIFMGFKAAVLYLDKAYRNV